MPTYSKNMAAYRKLKPTEQLKYLNTCPDAEKAAVMKKFTEADSLALHNAIEADPDYLAQQRQKLWGMGRAASLPGFELELHLAFHQDLAEVNGWELLRLGTEEFHNSILAKMKLDKFGFDPFDATRPVMVMLDDTEDDEGSTMAAIVLDVPQHISTPKQFTDWRLEVFRETGYAVAHLPNVFASPRNPGERLAAILVQGSTTEFAEPLLKLPKAMAQAGAGTMKAGEFQADYSFHDWLVAIVLNEMGSIRAVLNSKELANPTGESVRVLGRPRHVAWDKRMAVAAVFYGRLMVKMAESLHMDDALIVRTLCESFTNVGEDEADAHARVLKNYHHAHWQYVEAAKLMQEGCLLSYEFFSPEHYPATNLFMFSGSALWTNELVYEVKESEYQVIPKRS